MKNTQNGWGLAPSMYSFSDNIKPGRWALKLVSSLVTWEWGWRDDISGPLRGGQEN